jgi:hypothetical protein
MTQFHVVILRLSTSLFFHFRDVHDPVGGELENRREIPSFCDVLIRFAECATSLLSSFTWWLLWSGSRGRAAYGPSLRNPCWFDISF